MGLRGPQRHPGRLPHGAARIATAVADRDGTPGSGGRTRLRATLLVAIVAAWALALGAQLAGDGQALHHDYLIKGDLPRVVALGLFLLAWQAMIVAMMLPSSLPLVLLFGKMADGQAHPQRAKAAFLLGYAAVWTAFGAVAFLGDAGVHHVVDSSAWLQRRPWLIAGTVLVLAGAFQFSTLKDKCLQQCRNPGAYLLTRYRRGAAEAFRIGRSHGIFCLGCCWALMLVGFAAGVANLWWMAVLTAVMVFEKTGRGGERGVVPIGVTLQLVGVIVLLHPGWLPSSLVPA